MFSFRRLKTPIVRDTFIYTITDAIGKAMSFILLPLTSYYMPPEDLGVATNFTVLTSAISLAAGLAMVNSLPYFFYEQNKNENRRFISNVYLFVLSICIVFLLCVLCFHNAIYAYLKLDFIFQLCAVGYVILQVIVNLDLQLFRLEERPKSFAAYQLIQITAHVIFVVLFVVVLKMKGPGKIWAECSVIILMGCIHAIQIIRRGYISLHYDKKMMGKILKFGLPLMPHSISFWLKSGADKVFLTSLCGLYYNGIYSMAMSVCSFYTLLSNAFFNAYTPFIQKKLAMINEDNERREKRKIVKITYMMTGVFFVVCVVTILVAWLAIRYVLNDKYRPAFQFVPGIVISLYIYVVYSLTIQFIYKRKKTIMLGILTFSGSLVKMTCSYIFIKQIGAMGAVYSAIFGSALISVAIFSYSNKVYKLPWLYFLKNRSR